MTAITNMTYDQFTRIQPTLTYGDITHVSLGPCVEDSVRTFSDQRLITLPCVHEASVTLRTKAIAQVRLDGVDVRQLLIYCPNLLIDMPRHTLYQLQVMDQRGSPNMNILLFKLEAAFAKATEAQELIRVTSQKVILNP
jgi:hypothetical protein